VGDSTHINATTVLSYKQLALYLVLESDAATKDVAAWVRQQHDFCTEFNHIAPCCNARVASITHYIQGLVLHAEPC
jgi:hypothetical protein